MDYSSRIEKIQRYIRDNKKLDALFITSIPNIIFLSGAKHFVMDTEERELYLFITAKEAYMLTSPLYEEAIKKDLTHLKTYIFSSGNSFKKFISQQKEKKHIITIGVEEDNLKVSEYKFLKKYFKLIGDTKLQNMRITKDNREIQAIEEACTVGDNAFTYILKLLKIGLTEKQLAYELELFIRRHFAELSFSSVVCFGENSSEMHHVPSDRKLQQNDFVLLDFGVKKNNYCSDMTRTVLFGKATDKQKKLYNTVLSAQKKTIDYIINTKKDHPSKKLRTIDADTIARSIIEKQGFEPYPHGLGHGIGLQVHELPHISMRSKEVLTSGMVFTIEPGVYIPGYGGVRIEDVLTLTNNTLKTLTKSPKELIEI